MKYFYLLFFLWQATFAQVSPVFDFNKSLRIDFNLLTDANQTEVLFQQLKQEPHWGGPTANLLYPDYGEFRLQLFDGKQLVFSKGFNSLANEWKHTPEAKNEKRLFYHAVQVPFPKKNLSLRIDFRNFGGEFVTIGKYNVRPDDYFIKRESVTSYPMQKLLYNGDPAHKVDLVILAEGYTTKEMKKFYTDAKRMMDYMFTIPPFDALKKDFNVYAIAVRSPESGTDIPGKHIYKNTAFDASFYTFDVDRYLTTNSMEDIADVASLVPYDQIYVLVNTDNYGGGGFYNHLNLATANNELSTKVFVHEFGHGFVGLADEYFYGDDDAFAAYYNVNVEPWEQNITNLVHFESKWKDMMKEGTPIPTPRIETYKNDIGVFEGGGYLTKGMYSPAQDCRMRSNTPKGFCPVCERAIRQVVDFYVK